MDSSQGISNKWLLGLREAIESKNYSYLQEYLAAGLNFNTRETDGFTPLQIALRMNNIEMVRFLLENKADPNQDFLLSDQWSYDSPLHFTLAKRSSAMAILLIEYGANIFAMSHAKIPIICTAVKNDRVKVIRYLMDNGTSPDTLIDYRVPVVRYLMNNRTSPDTLINDKFSLLTYAVKEMKIGVIKCILKYKPNINLPQHKKIIKTAMVGNADICVRKRVVSILYKYGFTLDQTEIRHSVIFLAIQLGYCHIIRNFVRLGIRFDYKDCLDYNHEDLYDASILHDAVLFSQLEIVQVLLEAGADVHVRNCRQRTPIMTAAFFDKLSMVRLLLKYGANVTDVDDENNTVLHHTIRGAKNVIRSLDWSSNRIRSKMFQLLISKGADINVTTLDGWSPLTLAANLTVPEVIPVLLAHGARIDEVSSSGKTPLELAVDSSRRRMNELTLATVNVLQQHIHRFHRIGLPICSKDLEYNADEFKLPDDVNEIINSEVQFIKETKLGDSFVTLQRFIKSTDKEAAGFLENDSILKNLKMMLQSPNKFYGYANLIRNKLRVALPKKELNVNAFKLINCLFKESTLPSLPDECTRHIISFLTEKDKKVAIEQLAK